MSDSVHELPQAGDVYLTANNTWWRISRVTETSRVIYAGFGTTEYGTDLAGWRAWVQENQARKVDIDMVIAADDLPPASQTRLDIAATLLAPRLTTSESASVEQLQSALRDADRLIAEEQKSRG